MKYYAHSREGESEETWESLEMHLSAVATTAAKNAKVFGAESVGKLAGQLHDLGKVKPGFQAKLRGEKNDTSHSGEGARYAIEKFPRLPGKILAYCIAGHHTGLPNGIRSSGHPATPLKERLKQAEDQAEALSQLGLQLPQLGNLPGPLASIESKDSPHFEIQFFTRMLFSSLVDADRIETERFYSPDAPRGTEATLSALQDALNHNLSSRFGPPETDINRLRSGILAAAGEAADREPGFFSLTVPTGGGKTLASLKFALSHALAHNLRSVIHVAPFTAIIEQTADVFREFLDTEDGILEHHSAFQSQKEFAESRETENDRLRMAAENWDRPVVVTTAVQLFESLYANRTSKCRKLHNIARSVIILDEAQCLPLKYLRPCLAALRELVRGYGCTVVLCTATQPAVHEQDGLKMPEALQKDKTREIAPDPKELYTRLKRVKVSFCGLLTNKDLVDRIDGKSALVIVNNKNQARELFDLLKKKQGKGIYHLSTNMTANHRRDVLETVRNRLSDGSPVFLVATALVEAGVDLDFPEVWRAVAGIDSIAQAAGRCNREGKLDLGEVFIFESEKKFPPPPELLKNAEVARSILQDHPDDPLAPDAVTAYFRRLYQDRTYDLDSKRIMDRIGCAGNQLDYPFAGIAGDFRLIEEATVPLIVSTGNYGMDDQARQALEYGEYAGGIARKLQPFTIQVTRYICDRLLAVRAASICRSEDFGDQFIVLDNSSLYNDEAGLSDFEPENLGDLIV